MRNSVGWRIALTVLLLISFLSGCKRTTSTTIATQPATGTSVNFIELENRAVGLMGKFDFDAAAAAFTQVSAEAHERSGDLVNLAIAYLNRQQDGDTQRAEQHIDRALAKTPDDLRTNYVKGVLVLYRGQTAEALTYFRKVAARDPRDPFAVYYVGQCLLATGDPTGALASFAEAGRLDPSLRSANYGAFQALRQLKRADEAKEQLALFEKLKDDPQARVVEFKYTRMGPKAEAKVSDDGIVRITPPPSGNIFADPVPLHILNSDGVTWRALRADDSLPLTITVADIDGDGRMDLFITNALSIDGSIRNAVLLQREGGFEIALKHPLAAVEKVNAAVWGDFDNDGLTDVYLCRHGANQLWRQAKPGQWQDITAQAKAGGDEMLNTIDGAFIDADHDGDLDLFLVRSDGPNELLNNNGDGTFRPLAKQSGIAGDGRGAIGLVATDLNHDGTVDLIVLKREPPHEVYLNDRLWKYHAAEGFDAFKAAPLQSAVAADLERHGVVELLTTSGAGVQRWSPDRKNTWGAKSLAAQTMRGRLAVADVDGSGHRTVIGSTDTGWALLRPGASDATLAAPKLAKVWAIAELEAGRGPSMIGIASDGSPVEWKPGPGRYPFLTLSLSGRHNLADSMRSNASGVGVRVAARFGSQWTAFDTYRAASGPGQSAQPFSFGVGGAVKADFVRLIWPEGLQQTEMDLPAGKAHRIEETQRQTSSCPVIFAWDGERFTFVTDCLGVGGLGFAIAPNEYAPVRPWENVLLPQGLLKPCNGRYQLKLGEPMEEACYLDWASLVRYDLPSGWKMTLDERMGVNDPQPTGEARFYRKEMIASRVMNDRGQDVTDLISRADGKAADPGPADSRFIGFTAEHSIEMTFPEPIASLPGEPMLVIDGWIEYPYSQTMFAAWQAGVPYSAPTLEAMDGAGKWVMVLEQFGYPAGMPRQMSVPIPVGKLPAGTRTLRLRTNQEIYWDRIAVAGAEHCPDVKRIILPLVDAMLSDVGFPRRTTGPQKRPAYDYAHRSPLWDTRRQGGFYTEFGPVKPLLNVIDDAVAIFGPGEEINLEFGASGEAVSKEGTTRFVLQLAGWCKDRDLYTKDGDTIGPLPAREGATAETIRRRDALHTKMNTRYRGGE
jgi:Tfp pilus assembly protein PilF